MIVDGSHIDVAESVPVGRIICGAVVDDAAAELAGDVRTEPCVLVGAEEPVAAAVVPLLAIVNVAADELTKVEG
jgi:hypothetical protein